MNNHDDDDDDNDNEVIIGLTIFQDHEVPVERKNSKLIDSTLKFHDKN